MSQIWGRLFKRNRDRRDGSVLGSHEGGFSEKAHLTAHSQEIRELEFALSTSVTDGLLLDEAIRRLEEFGCNELSGSGGVNPWKVLLQQFSNALMLVITIAAVVAFVAQDYVEGGVITAVLVSNAAVGFFQEYRAERTMESLRHMASPTSRVIRNEHLLSVSTRDLVPGDVLVLKDGDVIGADARLFEVFNLQVDEAMLTGESLAVEKTVNKLSEPDTPIGDRTNMVYSSTTVTKGRGKAIVVSTGMKTEIGKIAKQLLESDSESSTPLQKKLNMLGYALFVFAVILAVIVMGVNRFQISTSVAMYAISVGIALIPEGIVAVISLTMAMGVRRMAKNRAIIRRLSALEALGAVTNICSDKTGTLTQSRMMVTKLWLPDSGYYRISGTGFVPKGDMYSEKKEESPASSATSAETATDANSVATPSTVVDIKQPTVQFEVAQAEERIEFPNIYENDPALRKLIECAALCNVAVLRKLKEKVGSDEYVAIGDPTESALQVFAHKFHMGKPRLLKKVANVTKLVDLHDVKDDTDTPMSLGRRASQDAVAPE